MKMSDSKLTNSQDIDWWQKRQSKIFSSKGGWKVGTGVFNFGLHIDVDVSTASGGVNDSIEPTDLVSKDAADAEYFRKMRGEGLQNVPFNMMEELVSNCDYFQVLVLNCTGRLPPKALGDWLSGLFICLSWPDPRLWCNAMGAFSATLNGRVGSGVTAGILSSDSTMFGSTEIMEATSSFMLSSLKQYEKGSNAAEILRNHMTVGGKYRRKTPIPGFARPLANGDERVETMRQLARKLGFRERRCERLAVEIEKELLEIQGQSINIAGYVAAFMSDQGFSVAENGRLFTTVVNSGVHACYAEEIENPPLSFKPTACADITYTGTGENSDGFKSREVPAR